MEIFSKQEIRSISDASERLTSEIADFASSIESILEEVNDEAKECFSRLEDKVKITISDINKNKYFSQKVKNRLEKQINFIMDELEQENFELDVNIDIDAIAENFNSNPERFLDDHLDLNEHRQYVENKINEIYNRISKIHDFTEYSESKHKFIIEKRNGIIAIKNRRHPDYLKNKGLDINISNSEVVFLKEGYMNPNTGWYIPLETIEEFKIYKKKLNSLFL